MYLFILFSFIVICFAFARTKPARMMIFFFSASIISGVLLGDFMDFYSIDVVIYVLFVCFTLYPLFVSFNYMDERRVMRVVLSSKNLLIIKIAMFFSLLGVLINSYILLMMVGFYLSSGVEMETFKNGGVGLQYFESINGVLRAGAALLTPLSYIFLPLHFYFLVNKQYRLSAISFISSLSIIFEQLIMFGRGGMVAFFFLYVFFISMVAGKIDRRFKRSYKVFLFAALGLFAGLFLYIAFDRFDNDKHFVATGVVTNPVVISFLSYYSQWLKNGYELFSLFSSEKIIFMSNFLYLPARVMEVFGGEKYDLGQLRMDVMGFESTYFNGLPALLLYDLHYLGTLAFSCFYFFSLRAGLGVRGIYSWPSYVLVGLAILIPLFFFQGPIFVFASYNFAIIYFLLIYSLTRIRYSLKSR